MYGSAPVWDKSGAKIARKMSSPANTDNMSLVTKSSDGSKLGFGLYHWALAIPNLRSLFSSYFIYEMGEVSVISFGTSHVGTTPYFSSKILF